MKSRTQEKPVGEIRTVREFKSYIAEVADPFGCRLRFLRRKIHETQVKLNRDARRLHELQAQLRYEINKQEGME